MKRLALCFVIGFGLGAQQAPSFLSVSQEDADKALNDLGQNLVTEGAKGIVGARARKLEGLSNLSQTKTKAANALQGTANKAQKATAIKTELAKKASWLQTWKKVVGVLDYGAAMGQAGGYLAEGDARGALGVLADTAGRKLSGWTAGAAGTLAAGPLGAVAGAALGESSWNVNPVKKWFKSVESEGRDRALADEKLGYRPTWRDHEAAEAKKKRDLEKASQDPGAAPVNEDEALRKQVESRLISQNLPVSEGLVNQLVGLIQSRGMDALEAALKECSAMQGTFNGTLQGRGALSVTVEGLRVSASFAHHVEVSHGGVSATATTTGEFTGTFDPVSGNVAFRGTLKTIAVAKGITPTDDLAPVSFTGHFTGQGFSGNAVANGQFLPWSVQR